MPWSRIFTGDQLAHDLLGAAVGDGYRRFVGLDVDVVAGAIVVADDAGAGVGQQLGKSKQFFLLSGIKRATIFAHVWGFAFLLFCERVHMRA